MTHMPVARVPCTTAYIVQSGHAAAVSGMNFQAKKAHSAHWPTEDAAYIIDLNVSFLKQSSGILSMTSFLVGYFLPATRALPLMPPRRRAFSSCSRMPSSFKSTSAQPNSSTFVITALRGKIAEARPNRCRRWRPIAASATATAALAASAAEAPSRRKAPEDRPLKVAPLPNSGTCARPGLFHESCPTSPCGTRAPTERVAKAAGGAMSLSLSLARTAGMKRPP
mmetsp:Transcript_76298/g.247474  ORF Transcript_76298/g.247474 Transcript_76298/m.247474 type:complete len:224 (-) Transcript_76298:40-711(-)